MKSKAQKQKDLDALTEQFKNAKAAMVVGFQKMTVAKDQELRNQAAQVIAHRTNVAAELEDASGDMAESRELAKQALLRADATSNSS